MRKFIAPLKKFLGLFATVSTKKMTRDRKVIRTFDLVSMVDNPRPQDLYMVYSVDKDDLYMIRWTDYNKDNMFDSGGDKMLVYPLQSVPDCLYKVDCATFDKYSVLMHSSMRELMCYATRFIEVFSRHVPLLGIFEDKKDGHCMLVVEQDGPVETGYSTVIDLTIVPTYGVIHNVNPMHVVKTSVILNNYSLRPILIETLVTLLKAPCGGKRNLGPLVNRLFDTISETDDRDIGCKLYGIATTGLVKSDQPPPIKELKKEIKV